MSKLFLIEDERPLGEMYHNKLSEAGFEVFWVLSAEEGLDQVAGFKPDLVILDLLLPEQNGVFFLENLRKMSENHISQTPVIVLSNYDEPEMRKKAESLDIEAYLLKTDYTPQGLVGEIVSIHPPK